jgi:FtsP/CotA-like multicopper oxidase with cupredoxin domain
VPQIWHLENKSGGWWHPIHIHSEFMRVLRRNGKQPPLNERDGVARKDTVLLRGGESVDVFLKFRDYSGPFVFHCHNIEHEDMAMMARFDIID